MNKPIEPAFLADMPQAQHLRLLNLEQTKAKTALGKTLIYQLVSKREFPAPVPLTRGGRRVGWLENEVDAYIRACAANRNQRGAK